MRRLDLDARLRASGSARLAGIDEAGRGPLAGPVTAAVAALELGVVLPGLDDSKRMTVAARERIYARLWKLRGSLVRFGIGTASSTEIDTLGIRPATFLAMRRAVADFECCPPPGIESYLVVVDGLDTVPGLHAKNGENVEQIAVVGADGRSRSVAAASVLAKVHRDAHMAGMARTYPEYSFERHKGYGTRLHMEALARYGPCPIHRKSFAPIRDYVSR